MTRLDLSLYLVADPDAATGDIVEATKAAVSNGVTTVQLRWKTGTDRELVAVGDRLREVTAAANVPLIVNDRVDIALAIGADGVHLGVDDMPLERARGLGGAGWIIGYSPETDDQARTAEQLGADYLGIGPFATTSTKPDAGEALGATEFARRRQLTQLPVVAIGGIGVHNALAAIAAGADGVAVVSAILRADDPGRAASALSTLIHAHR